MNSFHEDFTKDLRLCAGARYHSAPLDHWDPLEVAAPERHLSLGTDSWEERVSALENQNPAFAKIESMLHLYFKGDDSQELQLDDAHIDEEKEQVWLFGYSWFSAYYEFLMDTRSTRTEFYKKYHEAFLALMRRCLRMQPAARPAFRDIAALWLRSAVPVADPVAVPVAAVPVANVKEPAVATVEPTETTVVADSAGAAQAVPSSVPVASSASVPVSVPVVPASVTPLEPVVPPAAIRASRLVLVGERGHNKTRRSPRN